MTASAWSWRASGIKFEAGCKESWGVLTDDELDRTEGKWDRLVGLIKEKTGESASDVERRIREMMD